MQINDAWRRWVDIHNLYEYNEHMFNQQDDNLHMALNKTETPSRSK